VRIVCVGGGPAGLYFAILMKRRCADHQITVIERQPAEGSTGWGVVFWDHLLSDLHATDPETAQRMSEVAFRWHGQTLHRRGEQTTADAFGYSIGRAQLLDILRSRATELGVDFEFEREITEPAQVPDADLVVASDGMNSTLRGLQRDQFEPTLVEGRNKYLWLGTPQVFDAFTFPFVNTDAGWIWAHAYAYDDHASTFIVECSPETWAGLGFDSLTARPGIELLEEIFAPQLGGAPLQTFGPEDAVLPWLNFRTVTNERWHAGHTVLMGDAAHTTHFSIGSGMTLALQDAIALANELPGDEAGPRQFAAYEHKRRAELAPTQADAQLSAQWFEDVESRANTSNAAFFFALRSRRDPWVSRVPPKLYYGVHRAAERITPLRQLRSWIMPKARALGRRYHGRR
jgi:2-polyprenyl-6-methoxyphenol hydroxylase-like FAD-dependent oxidoreductase